MYVGRYTEVDSLELTLEFITPAFLGGADGNAELRSASFKGLLRYWWRVLYGARYINAGEESLKAKEAEIFGTSGAKGSNARQSQVHISIDAVDDGSFKTDKIGKFGNIKSLKHTGNNSARYDINVLAYLSYGHKDSMIKEGSSFSIKITASKACSKEVFQAFLFMIEYGGVGSKSRNGFGSMKIIENKSNHKLNPELWYIHKNPVGFSVLSNKSCFYESRSSELKWYDALYSLGDIYMNIRKNISKKISQECASIDCREFIAQPFRRSNLFKNKKQRLPKFMILHISKKDDRFYGSILTLPISFTDACKIKGFEDSYNKTIATIHNILDANLNNITQSILGGQKNGR